ncbi:MAG: hypothetical protein IJ428_04780 [Clostridia bacterium]|nr:hypothetical protein [Clostridia bacterium]
MKFTNALALILAGVVLASCAQVSPQPTDEADTTESPVPDYTQPETTDTSAPDTTEPIAEDSEPVPTTTEISLQYELEEYKYILTDLGDIMGISKIGDDGTAGDILFTAKHFKVFADHLITDEGIYTADLCRVCTFADYFTDFTITEYIEETESFSFTLRGTTRGGTEASISLKTSGYRWTDAYENYTLNGDTVMIDVAERKGFYLMNSFRDFGLLTVKGELAEERLARFGVWTYIKNTELAIDNGQIITYNNGSDTKIVGDYLVLPGIFPNYNTEVVDSEFNLRLDGISELVSLSDGRYLAMSKGDKPHYILLSESLEPLYEDERECLDIGSDYILLIDDDSIIKLYSPDNELYAEFCEYTDFEIAFREHSSGEYFKDGLLGWYFFITDYTDPVGDWHDYEYYYIPKTGESGMYDLGVGYGAMEKPVLYLYPTEQTDITVTFEYPERLTTVYPAYNDGWSVTASPNGTLIDLRGRSYYALYWEEAADIDSYEIHDGFCVAGEDSAAFLEEKLAALGFTEREANEFIIYWLPIMEANEYNIIRFELTDEREAANALNITPKPDSLLRMAMHIKPSDTPVVIAEQVLPTFERNGFVAVEWGGCVH